MNNENDFKRTKILISIILGLISEYENSFEWTLNTW
jgi:hypothetical protein